MHLWTSLSDRDFQHNHVGPKQVRKANMHHDGHFRDTRKDFGQVVPNTLVRRTQKRVFLSETCTCIYQALQNHMNLFSIPCSAMNPIESLVQPLSPPPKICRTCLSPVWTHDDIESNTSNTNYYVYSCAYGNAYVTYIYSPNTCYWESIWLRFACELQPSAICFRPETLKPSCR